MLRPPRRDLRRTLRRVKPQPLTRLRLPTTKIRGRWRGAIHADYEVINVRSRVLQPDPGGKFQPASRPEKRRRAGATRWCGDGWSIGAGCRAVAGVRGAVPGGRRAGGGSTSRLSMTRTPARIVGWRTATTMTASTRLRRHRARDLNVQWAPPKPPGGVLYVSVHASRHYLIVMYPSGSISITFCGVRGHRIRQPRIRKSQACPFVGHSAERN